MTTSPSSPRPPAPPLYERIKGALREGIVSGLYAPASLLPSEAALGAQFGASRITVRQALADLQNEGLIYRRHGKGTFVSQPKAFQNVTALQGFAEAMSAQGHAIRNRVLKLQTVPAPADVAQALRLAPGAPVTELHRVRLLDQAPVSLEVTWLPEALGRIVARADLVTRDVFLVLEQDAGVALGHATLAIDAALADHATACALDTGAGAPLLRVERLTHDAHGTPIDYERLSFRGDAFQYRLRLDRQVAASAQSVFSLQGTV
ncbi:MULTISPECIES: GntR family transcriptional regulator [Ralstonia]|uniref:GntR family transcriptional regulator n=1 Tax=Ralstonia TaxID=48736 RepID=UPI000AC8E39B|nr:MULTISPECIES: GntR family transcriptional regulator [Ralstonia]PLT17401.1 GntR family transcriptional regulator [Ralstonia mannitolilytica]